MFHNVPGEMRQYRQWVVWRLEKKLNGKDTKVPYNVRTGHKASVTNPGDWADFADVASIEFTCRSAVDPSTPVGISGFTGIGFVFTANDPFTGIDLDDTHGVAEDYERQLKIFSDFDSYSELSQSGRGLHIIVRGNVPHGRRRANIEVYSSERYFCITGNVHSNKFVINDRQEVLTSLWEQMGGPATEYSVEYETEEKEPDAVIIDRASKALNGEKFVKLWNGDFSDYPSQSEADFALVDIITFYTKNREQIRRLFRASALGQTPKDNYAHRGDRAAYVEYMVKKSFDRELPPIDVEALKIKFDEVIKNNQLSAIVELPVDVPTLGLFPPGLIGEVAQYIYDNSPTPITEIALAGAIGLIAGITGRAYNISRTGLNQYVLLLSPTGSGKEAMANGIANIMNAVCTSVPAAAEFRGPGELVSAPGLIRCFDKTPALFSIISEFGLKLNNMSNDRHYMHTVQAALLQLFNKSGKGNVFDFTAYSDKQKNIPIVIAPSLTLIGESTGDEFYAALDERMVKSGLLPRFLIIEFKGKVPYYRETNVKPPFYLIEKLTTLCAACLGAQSQNIVHDVAMTPEAKHLMDKFSYECTDKNNNSEFGVTKELWSRSHVKALKLAAVISVGIDWINPIITVENAKWCIEFVSSQNENLISKFTNDEVGQSVNGSSERKQQQDLIRVISEYSSKPLKFWEKYGVSMEMYEAGVIPYAAINRRLIAVASFRLDKLGSTNAIQRQLKVLLDGEALREMSKSQMQALFHTSQKAYAVADPKRFRPEK